jgi:hypothetical protein
MDVYVPISYLVVVDDVCVRFALLCFALLSRVVVVVSCRNENSLEIYKSKKCENRSLILEGVKLMLRHDDAVPRAREILNDPTY